MSATGSQYTEYAIARALMREKFGSMMMLIDNCYWPGNECDLLVVHPTLKLIDVEIKISRADLKKDREKDKWFSLSKDYERVWDHDKWHQVRKRLPVDWPRRIWKHYYVVADPIWTPALLEFVHPNSGVIKIKLNEEGVLRGLTVEKRVKANPAPYILKPEDLVKLGYLAGVRMLEAYDREHSMRCDRADEARRADEVLDQHVALQSPPEYWRDPYGPHTVSDNDFLHAP